MNKLLWIAVVSLALATIGLTKENRKYREGWERSMANVKAYDEMLSNAESKNRALRLTVSQLKNSKDSVIRKLDKVRDSLKIKEKNVEALHYIESGFVKTDTIVLTDTIFSDPEFKIDTTLRDEWYCLDLGLSYPSEIVVKPGFKSEKYIIVHKKKETVNPPKKFFLFRWFQKKHYVINVEVEERNPYVSGELNRYVEIVR